ncbi:MAG: aminotransferase DegT [Deltaproteobacteria bacterium]|nr:MAG: aminotransferase DegT [Deltaproteobacteria bacterium]
MSDFDLLIEFIRESYPENKEIFLHEPVMGEIEKKYLLDCIDSGFVSSVGEYVSKAEKKIAEMAGSKYAVCMSSGTAALHIALLVCGVGKNDLVLTQPLTFVATANAVKYCNAEPLFLDIDEKTLSLSPEALEYFFKKSSIQKNGECFYKGSGQKISACVPMHTFGHIGEIDKICQICARYNVPVIEDAAEAVGSFYKGRHGGTYGKAGIFSFNGNKIITSGGGGAVITDDKNFAELASHLSTTARKVNTLSHEHDMIGYNYRMPNINAAFLSAQLHQLDEFVEKKRKLAKEYKKICDKSGFLFFEEPENCISNFWLNSVFFQDAKEAQNFLYESRKHSIFPRMVWKPLHLLDIFRKNQYNNLNVTQNIYKRIINLPSSIPEGGM